MNAVSEEGRALTVVPRRDAIDKPGWHWLVARDGDKLPWRWLPKARFWRCGNQQITAAKAGRDGWNYWAPLDDPPPKPYTPLPLFIAGDAAPPSRGPSSTSSA